MLRFYHPLSNIVPNKDKFSVFLESLLISVNVYLLLILFKFTEPLNYDLWSMKPEKITSKMV